MKKTQLEVVKDTVARGAVEQAVAGHEEVTQAEALMFVGGVRAISNLSEKLSAQTVRAYEAFEQSKGYKALGYATFVEFLESPRSSMSKSQYYDRLGALTAEGDAAYDLLNNLNVPLSRRKLLAEGAVQVEGDTLIVGEERVPLGDRRRVVEAIRTLAESSAAQKVKIDKGTEQLKKVRKERDELKKRGGSGGSLDDVDSALLLLLGGFANLKALAFNLTDPERIQRRDYIFERIAEARAELEEALGVSAPSARGDFDDLSDNDVEEAGENF